jgi:sugar phosphate isomerase/epimerase
MKYGFCLDIKFLDGDAASRAVFDAVAEAGFDYVELPFYALSTCEKIGELKKELQNTRLRCLACNIFFPPGIPLVGADRDKQGIEKYLNRMLPLAEELGAETLVFGNGGFRRVPVGETQETVWGHLRELVETMDRYAEKTGIKIAVEPLNTTETDMINNYKQAVELTRGLQHVGAMVDSYHVLMENQSYADVLAHPEKLWHLHIAYSKKRRIPSPSDDKGEYEDFSKTIQATGYDDKISIEGTKSFDDNGKGFLMAEIKDSLEVLKNEICNFQ